MASRTLTALTTALGSVHITTFGYLHGDPPAATLTLDLRTHFKDPHVSPELHFMTAHDSAVREAVLNTPGITPLIRATITAVHAFLSGPTAAPVSIAVGCAGGRHRAATVGMELAAALADLTPTLTHRDLNKDVVDR
jgi:UPF0042 nucleotide-binding protein